MSKIRLSNEDYASILQAERQLHDILPDIDNAEECGVECQEYRRVHAEYMQQIEKLKAKFGPQSH